MESLLGLFDPSDDGCGRTKSEGVKCKDDGQLPPEPQLGNIEYKLKLLNPSKTRFQHLVTQVTFSFGIWKIILLTNHPLIID